MFAIEFRSTKSYKPKARVHTNLFRQSSGTDSNNFRRTGGWHLIPKKSKFQSDSRWFKFIYAVAHPQINIQDWKKLHRPLI